MNIIVINVLNFSSDSGYTGTKPGAARVGDWSPRAVYPRDDGPLHRPRAHLLRTAFFLGLRPQVLDRRYCANRYCDGPHFWSGFCSVRRCQLAW